MKQYVKRLFYLISTILIVTCANQGFPPGGPEDREPPFIVTERLIPPAGATRVLLDIRPQVEFNETVDRQTVEDGFFISPYPAGGYQLRWSGRQLKIVFPGTLDSNRTYVLTFGTDIRDLRRNRMVESFTFAFSTGDSLDKGQIAGRIGGSTSTEGVQIWAYPLALYPNPAPQQDEASYITQCNEDGTYLLNYLKLESYRLFAIIDKEVDRVYNPEMDQIGICTKDAFLSPQKMTETECNFQLTMQDTTRPGLFRIYNTDNRHVSIRFDESISKIAPDSIQRILIQQMKDGVPFDTLSILLLYQNIQNPSRIELITAPQVANANYLVAAWNFFDLWQNPLEPKYRTIEFVGSALPDTFPPQLVTLEPPDSSKLVPLDQKFEFLFSEALVESTFYQHLKIVDSSGIALKGEIQTIAPNHFQFTSHEILASEMAYRILFQADSIKDLFQNSMSDSAITYRFMTLNADTLGEILGTIMDELPTDSGTIVMKAVPTEEKGKTYEIGIEKPGTYRFKGIFPGTYLISGFRDRDRNGSYSYGKLNPWTPAERFFQFADTIAVRARWPNEGNDFTIQK
ncbi:Ig-like domain-containing protein [candidate division KSB1 bacterium]|nr:Ig-like domain-containing protein [candidate division KSB1 bacterium]